MLNQFTGLKQIEIEVLVPSHELLGRLLKDIAEIPVSSQGACIFINTNPRFILARDEQRSQASSFDLY